MDFLIEALNMWCYRLSEVHNAQFLCLKIQFYENPTLWMSNIKLVLFSGSLTCRQWKRVARPSTFAQRYREPSSQLHSAGSPHNNEGVLLSYTAHLISFFFFTLRVRI